MDTPANKRQCRNERHEEEMKVADAMATTEEDAAGIRTVVAEWDDEDNETGQRTMWDNKSWEHQWTMGSGGARGGGGW